MEFACKVGLPTGEIVERSFTADDEAALRADLEQKGFYIFTVRTNAVKEFTLRRPRVKMDTLLMFCQEMAALLKAGLPLLQGLDIMLERQHDATFKRSLVTVRDKIKTGISLSDAFKAEGDLYPGIWSSTLLAGERSGNLEGVIRRFVQYLRLTQALKKRAVSAAVYPVVLLVMMFGLVTLLVVFVMPQFKEFFSGIGGQLPLPTRLMLALSDFVRGNVALILVGLTAVVVGSTAWYRREDSKLLIDGLLLKIPVIGPLVRMYATSQLARTLSTLLAGGLPLLSALGVAANSIGNRAIAAAVAGGAGHIREGRSLTVALESTAMIDNLAIEMVKVGEQTGALGDMLNTLAEFYDQEMETRLTTVMGLVEPMLLIIMAVIVACMLLAFYLPMFSVFGSMQR